LKNGSLKYFCEACDQLLKEIPELKVLIRKLLTEVDSLKSSHLQLTGIQVDNKFIINEIGE